MNPNMMQVPIDPQTMSVPANQGQVAYGYGQKNMSIMEYYWNAFITDYINRKYPNVSIHAGHLKSPPINAKNPSRSIYVSDLPEDVTEEELRQFFSTPELSPSQITVIGQNKNKRSAVVEIPDESMTENLINLKDYEELRGGAVHVRLYQSTREKIDFPKEANLYLNEVDSSLKEKQLNDYFTRYGNIASLRLSHDSGTKQANGYGYIQFEKLEDAERCLREHPTFSSTYETVPQIRKIKLEVFKPKEVRDRESTKTVRVAIEAEKATHPEICSKLRAAFEIAENWLQVESSQEKKLVLNISFPGFIKASELVNNKEKVQEVLKCPVVMEGIIDKRPEGGLFGNSIYLRYLKPDTDTEVNTLNLKTYLERKFGETAEMIVKATNKQAKEEKEANSPTQQGFDCFCYSIVQFKSGISAERALIELPEDKEFMKQFLSEKREKSQYFINAHTNKAQREKFLVSNMNYKKGREIQELMNNPESQQRLQQEFMRYLAEISYASYNQYMYQQQMAAYGGGYYQQRGYYGQRPGGYRGNQEGGYGGGQ